MRDNILFQSPQQIILWQHGRKVLRSDITQPANLIEALRAFFGYQPPAYAQWEDAKLSGTTHNVFGIQVGVSITILVRKRR